MNGVYRAVVADSRDPDGLGRLKVRIPALTGAATSEWIYPVIGAGYVVVPKAGEQVWVLFEAGDVENPVWLGKTKVTTTGINKTNVGYATMIQRLEQAETDIATLKSQMTSVLSRLTAGGL